MAAVTGAFLRNAFRDFRPTPSLELRRTEGSRTDRQGRLRRARPRSSLRPPGGGASGTVGAGQALALYRRASAFRIASLAINGGMPLTFENTWLWRTAFVEPFDGSSQEEQRFFKAQFLAMRELVEPLVARVMRDMPGYTVHDITHLDALWETASLVAKPGLGLNPPEAFVLGGAILLHDAAMTLAAYPGGLEDLKNTAEWADIVAGLTGEFSENIGPEVQARATVEALRLLHASKAAELAVQHWTSPDHSGDQLHLIERSDLRHFYGPSIGTIAHSHWWSIAQVERDLNRHLGAMPPHTSLSVDLLKLACILRVADAIHLDRRRAPPFVRALDRPRGHSGLHWTFQSRLSFPRVEDDALIFTASEAFQMSEAESWWLGFDAFAMADRELRDTDLLLRETGRNSLAARRVKGILSPADMARFMPVRGWKPVETKVHVSDIPHIIETLGGSKLYGQDAAAPIRELIQNGMDAIQARKRLEGRPVAWGLISVELKEDGGEIWLSIEDNGVGMSENVLTGALLDFGSSFWKSTAMGREFPTLKSRGMDSIGRFGIGFFSVFMLGDVVRVTSRRYDKAAQDALTLTFSSGLGSRPILSTPRPSELPIDGGTRVDVKLRFDPRTRTGIRFLPEEDDKETTGLVFLGPDPPTEFRSLDACVAWIAPTSPVNIRVKSFGDIADVVNANDWLTNSGQALASRMTPSRFRATIPKAVVNCIRPVLDADGRTYGRAALSSRSTYWSPDGALVSAGLRLQPLPNIVGVLEGRVATASRNSGSPIAPPDAIARWANEQRHLITRADLPDEQKAENAELILRYGGDIGSLPLVRQGEIWYSSKALRAKLTQLDEVKIYVGDIGRDDQDEVGADTFERTFKFSPTIFWIPTVMSPFPGRSAGQSQLLNQFETLVAASWKTYHEDTEVDVVGIAGHEDIYREIVSYTR